MLFYAIDDSAAPAGEQPTVAIPEETGHRVETPSGTGRQAAMPSRAMKA